MVERILRLLSRETKGIHEAAYLLAGFALLSQLLAFFRDRLLAGQFGAGEVLDLYYASFRIPDFIFVSAASVVSVSILIPFLLERINVSHESARRFVDTIFSAFVVGISLVSAVVFFFVPNIVPALFPGFGLAEVHVVSVLTRIMLLQPILLGLSNLFGSIAQAEKRFLVYALSPIFYNAGIIFGIVFLEPYFGFVGLGWGVVLGAVLHLSIQIPTIIGSGLFPRPTLRFEPGVLKSVLMVSIPRTLALSANHIVSLILLGFGSVIGTGAISIFTLSWNIQSVPLIIIGASYSLAAFPTLVRLFADGNRERFNQKLSDALRHIVFWSMPAMVLFIVLRAQIIRTIYGTGAFDWSDTRLTAASLAIFAVSVVAQGILLLFVRAFYASGKTKIPFYTNMISGAVTIFMAFCFLSIFNSSPFFQFFIESLLKVVGISGTAVLMLPLAYSIGTISNVIVLWLLFERFFGRFSNFVYESLYHSFASSIIMGFGAYSFLNVFDNVFSLDTLSGIFLQGFCSGISAIFVGILILVLLGNREIREVFDTLHHKIWGTKIISPDPLDSQSI